MQNITLTKNEKIHGKNLKFTSTVKFKDNTYVLSNQLEISVNEETHRKQSSTRKLKPFQSQNLNEINSKFEEIVENYLTEFKELNQPIIIEDMEFKFIFQDLLNLDKNTKFLACGEFLNIDKDEWLAKLIIAPDKPDEFLPPVTKKLATDEIFDFWDLTTQKDYIPNYEDPYTPIRFSSAEIKLATNLGVIDIMLPVYFRLYPRNYRENENDNGWDFSPNRYKYMGGIAFKEPEIWINDKLYTKFELDFIANNPDTKMFDIVYFWNGRDFNQIMQHLNHLIRFPE